MSFPLYKQLDSMDCGPTCLRMISKFYGKSYGLQLLRDKCHITREGVSLLGISDAAESIGFRTNGVKITWKQLTCEIPLPCIVHWNQKHFVVVYDIIKRRRGYEVCVADPASGLLKYAENDFKKCWLKSFTSLETMEKSNVGIALLLEPTLSFYQEEGENKTKYGFAYVLQYLRPYKSYILHIVLSMIVGSIISLIIPFITQSIVDNGISNKELSFVVALLIAQFLLALGQLANSMIRSWLMLHTTTRVSILLISDFLCKLMKLPIAFFDSKKVGDIMQRIGDYNRISSFLTGTCLSMVVAIASFIIYGCVMANYDISILLVFFAGVMLYISWVLLFMKQRKKLDYMRFQEAATNQNNIVQLVTGMQDIKLNNCEKQKRWEWEKVQAKLFKVGVKGLALGQAQEVGGVFIDQTKNILISFLAAKSVIIGDMTLGMMMALQYIMGQMNAPISQFISFVQTTQDAKISLERLAEIHEKDDEESSDIPKLMEIPHCADIVFDNVSFQYDGPHSNRVLKDISITVPYNKVTAIVGASGSGKTTLLKMMLGFYRPVNGEIRLGGTNLHAYSERIWRGMCGSVMQEGYIFSDTILGNIGLKDELQDIDKVRQAADVSNIRNWIEELPLGYGTRIGVDGHGLSTGQKQRILIARAAYKDAKYLFFDEATNSLDANNEKAIMENFDKLFVDKTVVIVAHRLSTVKNADNIIVLDNGAVAEQGTHSQLISNKGMYYQLIKNQLELES